MSYLIIAPVGDHMDALFVGIREFPTKKVVLVSPENRLQAAEGAKKDLEKFQIPVDIIPIKGNIWEETFRIVCEVKKANEKENIMINVATGDWTTRCAATSAAFVNGIKAFTVSDNQIMLLPILKFSYYKILTERKMKILQTIHREQDCCSSLEELSKKTSMSLPLISYHINGNPKSEGLKEMGLVETTDKRGKTEIRLTTLGRMLMKGYITTEEPKDPKSCNA
ncbi:MAG: hypothetical protein JXB14_07115 [Candidatus Altiarchaeota archaeon]|nr:hypothetical protein [Candidatus Altiarchaeota archaeon]